MHACVNLYIPSVLVLLMYCVNMNSLVVFNKHSDDRNINAGIKLSWISGYVIGVTHRNYQIWLNCVLQFVIIFVSRIRVDSGIAEVFW